mgnify:CR=1 FL=1
MNIPKETPSFESPDVKSAAQMLTKEHPILSKVPEMKNSDTRPKMPCWESYAKMAAAAYAKDVVEYKVKGRPFLPMPAKANAHKLCVSTCAMK